MGPRATGAGTGQAAVVADHGAKLGVLCVCLGGCALTFGVLPIALGKALGRGGCG